MMVKRILPFVNTYHPAGNADSGEGINSLEKVNLGGVSQWILIRGNNKANPILLFLHGGPGAAQISFAPKFQSGLEKNFLVVNWDQRGSGKSYTKEVKKESMNIDQFVSDTYELTRYLLDLFKRDKLYLVAHSWGSIVGLLTVKKYPELFNAYVGIGQAVDMQQTARILCEFNYNAAKKMNNKKAFKEIGGIGYPPKNGTIRDALLQIKWLEKFGGIFEKPYFKKNIKRLILLSGDYSLMDKLYYKSGSMFSFKSLFNELINVNLFRQVPEVAVPVYFCTGCYDYNTPFMLTERYYKVIKAPGKKLFWFGQSGHAPHFEEPEKFSRIMIDTVLKETFKPE